MCSLSLLTEVTVAKTFEGWTEVFISMISFYYKENIYVMQIYLIIFKHICVYCFLL